MFSLWDEPTAADIDAERERHYHEVQAIAANRIAYFAQRADEQFACIVASADDAVKFGDYFTAAKIYRACGLSQHAGAVESMKVYTMDDLFSADARRRVLAGV